MKPFKPMMVVAAIILPSGPDWTFEAWSARTQTKLVEGRYFMGTGTLFNRQNDVSADGQRFLMIKEGGSADQTAAPTGIIVVQHRVEE